MALTMEEQERIKEEEIYRHQIRDGLPSKPAKKNKLTAALLAFFLGTFGIHKFYLNRSGQGFVYLLLFWTGIPSILGLFEGIIYLITPEYGFDLKYNATRY